MTVMRKRTGLDCMRTSVAAHFELEKASRGRYLSTDINWMSTRTWNNTHIRQKRQLCQNQWEAVKGIQKSPMHMSVGLG